ncbi:MAG: transposase [Clostridia bacterium]|nr:transposase [Clostridia bacterium]
MIHVDPELEAQIIKLHFQDGRTQTSLADEFGLSRNVIRRILITYRETTKRDKEEAVRLANMEQLRRLQKENEELKKENDFLKKAAAFFAKESK